jgi:hypothetical protein
VDIHAKRKGAVRTEALGQKAIRLAAVRAFQAGVAFDIEIAVARIDRQIAAADSIRKRLLSTSGGAAMADLSDASGTHFGSCSSARDEVWFSTRRVVPRKRTKCDRSIWSVLV